MRGSGMVLALSFGIARGCSAAGAQVRNTKRPHGPAVWPSWGSREDLGPFA
jgi:hypothetical protein